MVTESEMSGTSRGIPRYQRLEVTAIAKRLWISHHVHCLRRDVLYEVNEVDAEDIQERRRRRGQGGSERVCVAQSGTTWHVASRSDGDVGTWHTGEGLQRAACRRNATTNTDPPSNRPSRRRRPPPRYVRPPRTPVVPHRTPRRPDPYF